MNETTSCPGPETIAAFLDGALSQGERRAVVVHLDSCEACYEQVVEFARFQSEEEPSGRVLRYERLPGPRYRWAALAASVVAAALLATLLFVNGGRRSDVGAEALIAAMAAKPPATGEVDPWPGWPDEEAYAFSPRPPDETAFRIGVRLADLHWAAKNGDVPAVRAALDHLQRAAEGSGAGPELIDAIATARRAATSPSRLPSRIGEIEALAVEATEPSLLAFGTWAELSRLAAGLGDADYFAAPAFVSTRDELMKAPGLAEFGSTFEAIRSLTPNREAPEPAEVAELERHFVRLVRDYTGAME